MADCKVKEEAVAARSIYIANRREIETLTVADAVANKVQIENLNEANRELKETIHTLQEDDSTTSRNCFHQPWP